jgi:hypothetical protein
MIEPVKMVFPRGQKNGAAQWSSSVKRGEARAVVFPIDGAGSSSAAGCDRDDAGKGAPLSAMSNGSIQDKKRHGAYPLLATMAGP